ncbi:Lrp/AsnC family transcriptional regulator [Sphingomonas sp.]|uniref:Lrp/AsnC family transcriptional regulator n=1 Tax=Sphingomonas sp. TaxID=28214 RepID=UPI00286B3E47|nr:Lrp/AsnC family transcriptional regulator [Sphingomonas sp.]
MDVTDLKILGLLQEDAALTLAEVAAQVNLSPTPCWRRINKLETAGVIERRVALLDPAKVGIDLTIFVTVETDDHSEAWTRAFADAIATMPEVMEVFRMAGEVDYLLKIAVPNIAAYDAFYRAITAAVPLKTITSMIAMETVKRTTAFPLVGTTKR